MRTSANLLLLILGATLTAACSGGAGDSTTQSQNSPPAATSPNPSIESTSSPPSPPPPVAPSPVAASLQKILFWRQLTPEQRNLYLINEDGTGIVPVADTAGAHVYKATAPNGRIIYETSLNRQVDLMSVNPDGTGAANLTASAISERFNAMTSLGHIVFTRHQQVAQNDPTHTQADIYRMAADGASVCAVATAAAKEIFLALTHDDRIIFETCVDGFCTSSSLHVANCETSAVLAEAGSGNPRLIGVTSSGRIVYLAPGDGTSRLYSANTDGSDRRLLAAAGVIESALVHADAVIYTAGFNGKIHRISADGGSATALTEAPGRATPKVVTADGRLIYETGYSDASPDVPVDVYSVRLDGTDRRTVAATEYREIFDSTTKTGRLLYQTYPYSLPNAAHLHELRSANSDGTADKLVATATQHGEYNRVESVTDSNRVLYYNIQTNSHRFDLYAVNDDGSERRHLASMADYGATTTNDLVIYTSCPRYTVVGEPPLWARCRGDGDVVGIKTDGSGTVPLASGAEQEGFEAIYGPKF